MEYKYKYKDDDDRKNIIKSNKSMFLIEEQNITEGNFLIFSDIQPTQEEFPQPTIQERVSLISEYASLDNSILENLENTIIDYETNLILNGVV